MTPMLLESIGYKHLYNCHSRGRGFELPAFLIWNALSGTPWTVARLEKDHPVLS